MARRIAFVVIALVTVLLGAVAAPLGLITASHDRRDFAAETAAAAMAVAVVAEEHLDERSTGPALQRAIAELRRRGDQVAAYDAAGRRLAGPAVVPGVTTARLRAVLRSGRTLAYSTPGRLLVLAPVGHGQPRARIGVVALSSSAEPLEHRLTLLWTWLAAVAAAGLVGAALVATALARWVSRPLGGLDDAARHLGDGRLAARAEITSGPPEISRLAGNFNQMAGRLEALVDGHRAMMADVSHQLRTPLAALRLRLDVLAQESPQDMAAELSGAQEEVARLSRMVDGLLAVARAENQTVAAIPVRVDTVLDDRVQAWRPAAEEKRISLGIVAPGPLTARLADGQLEQILDNLLANALDAVRADGKVLLGATQTDGRVTITVADNGPGMNPQQRRAAFRRYLSGNPAGTGLGLAIVHRMVTSAGGSVRLSDTDGGGLTVTLDLPATQRS